MLLQHVAVPFSFLLEEEKGISISQGDQRHFLEPAPNLIWTLSLTPAAHAEEVGSSLEGRVNQQQKDSFQLLAAKPRTPSSTKLNPAPPLRTEETVYLILDLTKPLRSELGKENLDHVNGGRASEWAQEVPGLGVAHMLQRLTFWENCKPPSLEPMGRHRAQENAQEGGQSLSSTQPNTSKQQPSKATPAQMRNWSLKQRWYQKEVALALND